MKQGEFYSTLKKREEIRQLFDRGKKLSGNHVFYRYIILPSASEETRVLFTIPRGKLSAVGRNRQKRILRAAFFEAFREITEKRKNVLSGTIIGVFPRPSFFSLDFLARVRELRRLEELWDIAVTFRQSTPN